MVWRSALVALALTTSPQVVTAATTCDAACLEGIGSQYIVAYLKRDPKLAPFAGTVRFIENNVEMPLPDGSWDAVSGQAAPTIMFSDPQGGGVGISTGVMLSDTQGFLAVRLKVAGRRIVEVEHMLSTKRGVSGPPTPIGTSPSSSTIPK